MYRAISLICDMFLKNFEKSAGYALVLACENEKKLPVIYRLGKKNEK